MIGTNSSATGFACVSVGDGVVTRGAFQVDVRDNITFPERVTGENGERPFSPEDIDRIVAALDDIVLTYDAFEAQNFSPPGFASRARSAIDLAKTAMAKHRETLISNLPATPMTPLPPSTAEDVTDVTETSDQVLQERNVAVATPN